MFIGEHVRLRNNTYYVSKISGKFALTARGGGGVSIAFIMTLGDHQIMVEDFFLMQIYKKKCGEL